MQLLLKIWHLRETDKSGVLDNRVTLANFCPMEHHIEVTHIKMEVVLFKKLDCDVLVAMHRNQMIEKSLLCMDQPIFLISATSLEDILKYAN